MTYRVFDDGEFLPRRGRRGMFHGLPLGEIGDLLRQGKAVAVPKIAGKSEKAMCSALKRAAKTKLAIRVTVTLHNGELVMRAAPDRKPAVEVDAVRPDAERHDPARPPQPEPTQLGSPRPDPVYSTEWGRAGRNGTRFPSDTEAANELVELIDRAAKDKPFDIDRFIDFLGGFWRFCREHRHRLEQIYIPARTWQSFPAARDGAGNPDYCTYRGWLQEQGVVKLLVPGQKGEPGKQGIASLYRVAIPMCDGNPWPLVRAMRAGGDDGMNVAKSA